MIDLSSLALLKGKKALVTGGIANDQSIAWGCAKAFHALGAEVAGVASLNDKAKPYVEPLAKQIHAPILMPLDLRQEGRLKTILSNGSNRSGASSISPPLHRLRPKNDLQGRVLDCSNEGFLVAMECVLLLHPHGEARGTLDDFRRNPHRHELPRRPHGGRHYNLMGPVKAALESRPRDTSPPNSGQRASAFMPSRQAR